MKKKQYTTKAESLDDKGALRAVFSVFDVIDSDGDVVKASAISDGKAIPLVWAHNWDMPVGRGVIKNDGKKAIFDGHFFLDSDWGRNAYETVKAMGDLQEYSWGFSVKEQQKGEQEGRAVNNILKTEEYEVSCVLVGANRQTETLEVKSATNKCMSDYHVDGSYEALRDELNTSFRDAQFTDTMTYGYTWVVSTFSDHFIATVWKWDDEEESYWDVKYGRDSNGNIVLGEMSQVQPETSFVPIVSGQAMSYNGHSDAVQVAVSELVRRSKSGSDTRVKEGRAISAARLERMSSVVGWLNDAAKEIQQLIDEATPKDAEDTGKVLYAQFLRTESEILGVKVG